jgi:hypothetical protein
MHTLGLYHEHQRPGRDEFVNVLWEQVDPCCPGAFPIVAGAINNGPYDFASIMHYPAWSFSIDGGRTLDVLPPHQKRWQYLIGQMPDLSNGDVWTLIELYGGDPPPRSVVLTFPPRESILGGATQPTFTWAASDAADSYTLLVDDDDDFSSPIVDVTLAATSYAPGAPLTANRIHYWSVTAHNGVGSAGPLYDERWRFYTGTPAAIVHVDDSAPDGGDGATWSTAFRDLQDGLGVAALADSPVTEIRIGAGTYRPDRGTGSREAAFDLADGVVVRGGYAGFGAPDPDARDVVMYESVLTGDLAGDDGPGFASTEENALHVVVAEYVGSGTRLEGVTIHGGNANVPVSFVGIAPAMLALDAEHVVADCTFTAHQSLFSGTLYAYGRSMTVERCVFTDNHAGSFGAAILTDWRCDMQISDSRFEDNTADVAGGAIAVPVGSPRLDRCSFARNSAQWGGAASMWSGETVTFVSCLFVDNESTPGSGGGAAISCTNGSHADIINATFEGNTSATTGGAAFLTFGSGTVVNGIMWGNDPNQLDGGWTVDHSIVEGGWAGAGSDNLDADPMFVDAGSGDLHLAAGSPAVDAGDTDGLPSGADTDLDGLARVAGDAVDMGAYERPGPGDVDGDGDVDFFDLVALLAAWGDCPPPPAPCPADFDGNGTVGLFDLLALLSNWT